MNSRDRILCAVLTLTTTVPAVPSVALSLQGTADSTATSVVFRDYQYVKRLDPWFCSGNAAALTRFGQGNISEAELQLTRAKGGFTDFDGSPDVWQSDARVESFFRLSSKTVCYGQMSYGSFDGKAMAGSALTPFAIHRPFDLVEDSLMNTGDKHQNLYRLVGAVGTSLWRSLSVGARIDYVAADYAKYKDLRHQNKLMDLRLTAGLYLPLADWGALGANYLYHRNTESVTFGTYGKNEKVYQTLVSYAAFMGRLEQFGVTGFTDKNREMPLVTDEDGFSLQLSLQPFRRLSLYQAFGYGHARGYYGRKSPFTITYTGHQSDAYAYQARLTREQPLSRLSLDVSLAIDKLRNDANTYRELQNQQGATYYQYYHPVKTADKLWADLSVTVTADLGLCDSLPVWTLQAGYSRQQRRQTAYLYPYSRRQDLTRQQLFAAVTRHLTDRHGRWSITAQASFAEGSGSPFEEHTFQPPSDKQTPPPSMDAWLYREHLYLTAPQYVVGLSAQYAFRLPGTTLQPHARLGVQHQKANQTNAYAAGCDRTTLSVALGCTF